MNVNADPMRLLELMFPSTGQCLAIAAERRIADLLAGGPLALDQLAAKSGTHPASLGKILEVLAEDGVFTEVAPGVFGNTPLSELLQPGVPRSQHAMAQLAATSWLWSCWGRLDHSVATGAAAFNEIFGTSTWEWLHRNPGEAQLFNAAMTDFSEALGPAIAESYAGFGEARVIADLGGGQGRFLRAILDAHPSVERGILADLPAVINEATEIPAIAELVGQGRLSLAAGDFFASAPAGVELYTTKQIMHSWSDEQVVALLRRCQETSPGARIAAVELVHDQRSSKFVKEFDLVMLITMAGAIRTAQDFTRVFATAGYRVTGVVPTGTAFSVVEAAPVG